MIEIALRQLSTLLALACLAGLIGCQTVDNEGEESTFSGENVWGQAGSSSFPRAAAQMAKDFPEFVMLTAKEQKALRPVFGSLVERVQLHWNARPLNEMASDSYGITVAGSDTVAQAYGVDIYLKGEKVSWKLADLADTLIHELTHVLQFEDYQSSYEDFGYAYFKNYYLAGQVYENNILEQEAYNKALAYEQQVLNALQAP